MALYWSGARVKVRYEDGYSDDERDCPKDTIVIVMKPGQEDDPSFVRAVRHVVALRTLEHEMGHEDEPGCEDVATGEKDEASRGREDQAAFEAERRFVERFLDDEERNLDETLLGRADELAEEDPFSLGDLFGREACGDWGGCHERYPMQIVIEHCDEMVIGR